MAESSVVKKLQVKPGQKIAFIQPPPGYVAGLGQLPPGTEMIENPGVPVDVVQLFVKDSQELEKLVPSAIRAVKHDSLLWVSYPKGTSKVKTDLNRDRLWQAMEKHGFAGVSLISIDNTWSAMRFRPKEKVGEIIESVYRLRSPPYQVLS
ncbi:MAG: hypothetical protein HYX83_00230 [Chloroflexi bacterium]|nr:hypothetical protein [Chloroflexota bacterium]